MPNARKRYEWKLKDRVIQLGDRTLIVGILNVTPDSFSDGGKYMDPDCAFARAIELEEMGADILDIGAESTRPGSARIPEGEELRRLIPVLKRLEGKLNIPISVDTYKSAVAERALEHGALIINDPSGLTFDPQIAKVTANFNAGLIVNHMRGTPETWTKLPSIPDLIGHIGRELDAAVNRALLAGLGRKQIVIDPGLGFGKRKEQNAEILARLADLTRLELPLLVGPSRKHFVSRETPEETDFATAGAVAAAIFGGAHLVRVHDVKDMRAVAQVVDSVIASMPEPAEPAPRAERPPRPPRHEDRRGEPEHPPRRFPEPRPQPPRDQAGRPPVDRPRSPRGDGPPKRPFRGGGPPRRPR